MILYFADRKMNIVGTAFTNKSGGYICYNDKETSEVDTGTVIFTANVAYPAGKREEAMQRMQSGNYMFVADDDGNAIFYTIVEMESTTLDRSVSIYAEDIGLDLLNNLCDPLEVTTPWTLKNYLDPFILGIDLEKGDWDDPISETTNDSLKVALSLSEQTAKERLQQICAAFDVEPFVTFKIEGTNVTHKYLNVKQKRGTNNHVHLVIGREVNDIRVKQSVSDLATALKPKGSRPDGSTGIKTYTEPLPSGGYRQFYTWLKFITYDEYGYPVMGDSTSGAKFILTSRIDETDPVESEDISDYYVKRFNHKGIYLVKPQVNTGGYLEFKDENDDPDRYTWIRFSPNEDGSSMTSGFTYGSSKYIGIATNKDNSTQTSDPGDYTWTEIAYNTAEKQIVILSGDGTGVGILTEGNNITSNVWIRYSANEDGSGMTNSINQNSLYVGLCYERGTTESNTPSDYEWVPLSKATRNGLFVETEDGVNRGLPHTNRQGETKYIHYRFAGDEFGSDISYDANGSYIGISKDHDYPTPMSMDPDDYIWSPVDGVKIDGIDLVGYEYTEQDEDGNDDIYVEDGVVKSYKALQKWGRFVTDANSSSHIVRSFTYETTDRRTLLEETVKQLKKVREPAVTYEVSLIYMPEGLSLGDTVYITDPEGGLYLEARLLKLEKEYCNKQITATFGDYKVVQNDLADELVKLKERVEKQLENLTTYTWIVYADDSNGAGMSVNSEGKRWMGIATNKLTKTPDLTNAFLYSWSKLSIKEELYTRYYYGCSNSFSTLPSTWTQDNVEPDASNPYLWSKGTRYFNDGTNEIIPPHVIGVYGKGISSIVTYYGLSQSDSVEPTNWVAVPPGTMPVITSTNKYLWSYEVITYTDGSTPLTGPRKIIGAYGKDGISITNDTVYYKLTNSETPPATTDSGWIANPDQAHMPVLSSSNRYLWTYEVINYSDGTNKTTPVHLIGVYGQQGAQGPQGPQGTPGQDGAPGTQGDTGRGIINTFTQYYLSSDDQHPTDGSWTVLPDDDIPTYILDWYYFIRTVTEWSAEPFTTYSDPVLDMAMTTSNRNAYLANTTANGKNSVFYQDTPPVGTKDGDIWYKTVVSSSTLSNVGAEMYIFDHGEWVLFQLADNALAEISASKISAGTIDATDVTILNLDAGWITTGVLDARFIKTGKLQSAHSDNYIDLDSGIWHLGDFVGKNDEVYLNIKNSVNDLMTNIKFTDRGVEIQKQGSTINSVFGNSDLTFYQNGTEVMAWVSALGFGTPSLSIGGDPTGATARWNIYSHPEDDGVYLSFTRVLMN